MKGITLWQPWASLIAAGLKQYETRHWYTHHRGPLIIHAAKRKVKQEEIASILSSAVYGGVVDDRLDQLKDVCTSDLPLGAIVAVVKLVDCPKMAAARGTYEIGINSISALERAVGYWEIGRYAWQLSNVQALPEPIPAVGAQGLWTPNREMMEGLPND